MSQPSLPHICVCLPASIDDHELGFTPLIVTTRTREHTRLHHMRGLSPPWSPEAGAVASKVRDTQRSNRRNQKGSQLQSNQHILAMRPTVPRLEQAPTTSRIVVDRWVGGFMNNNY